MILSSTADVKRLHTAMNLPALPLFIGSSRGLAARCGARPIQNRTSGSAEPSSSGSKAGRVRRPKMSESELEDLLREKKLQYKQLRAENAFLNAKLHLLERAVPLKDEIVCFLANRAGITRVSDQDHATGIGAYMHDCMGPGQASSSGSGSGSGAADLVGRRMSSLLQRIIIAPGTQLSFPMGALPTVNINTPAELQMEWRSFATQVDVLATTAEVHGPTSPFSGPS